MEKITYVEAIKSLAPGASFGIYDNDLARIDWQDESISQPSDADIETELVRLQSEFDALAYSRNRADEYPNWDTQLNKIYDDGLTKWKSEMVDPVKAKWPKDNSGPV